MEYPNFYENIPEAHKRLHNTIVMYNDEPYYVLAITGHRPDEIFRVYMCPLGEDTYCPPVQQYHREDFDLGPQLDKWLETGEGKNSGIVRKTINSPKFNKFRPFPIGMCNQNGKVYYLERIPNRKTEQGLIPSMVMETPVTASAGRNDPTSNYNGPRAVDVWATPFRETVFGNYPDPDYCLAQMNDPEVTNEAAAFHREFALVRGPLDMMFLAYQAEVIGILPSNNFGQVIVGRDKGYTREVIDDLKIFGNISLNK